MSQLEKAREATDAANIRAEYAEITTELLTGSTIGTHEVNLTQTVVGWETPDIQNSMEKAGMEFTGTMSSKGKATLTINSDSSSSNYGKVTVTLS